MKLWRRMKSGRRKVVGDEVVEEEWCCGKVVINAVGMEEEVGKDAVVEDEVEEDDLGEDEVGEDEV